MKQLLHYFKGFSKEISLGPLFKLAEAMMELCVPIIVAYIIDQVIGTGRLGLLGQYIAIMVGLAFLGLILAIVGQYFAAKASIGYTQKLSRDLFRKILLLNKVQQDELTAASLITRLTSDTNQIQTGLNLFFRLFLRSPFVVIGSVLMAWQINRQLTFYFLGMILILVVVVVIVTRLTTPRYQLIRRQLDRLVSLTREQMQGMRVIRAFTRTSDEIKAFNTANHTYTDSLIQVGRLAAILNPVTYMIVNVTLILVIYQGGHLISIGGVSQGQLVAMINYLSQILFELLRVAMLINYMNKTYTSAQRISSILALDTTTPSQAIWPIDQQVTSNCVELDQVTFTYPMAQAPALEAIEFKLKQGDFFGIIGGTGSGKTSLIDLLMGLYQPDQGQVKLFFEGQRVQSPSQLRQHVALVPQKAELFKGTIRSNLTLGTGHIPDEDLWQALRMAQADQFVADKEGQLDAVVEAFGKNFSGGQRQRLTIARALLRQPQLLILDDATSALDYMTEARILQALKQMGNQLTLIMVSQRTNSIQSADQILLLDQGKQVALTSHQDLLKTQPLYQSIYYSQHTEEVDHHEAK